MAASQDLQNWARFAELALAAVHREYPSHVVHLLETDGDARPPRELTPAFYGSFDWHSAVHGHWTLARVARLGAADPAYTVLVARCRAALDVSLTPDRIAGEVAYVGAPARRGFERPYGLAWLLQLAAELREWQDAGARRWQSALAPLEAVAVARLMEWLPRLPWPIRGGEHSQTAFALGLALDWARTTAHAAMADLIRSRARAWYGGDADAPIGYEPSGHDFLSPALGEADLMRRVLDATEFGAWLDRFLPALDSARARRWLEPVVSPDPADGKLAHLDGLNLSRAWMLRGVASALPDGERRRTLEQAADRHAAAGLEAVSDEHYAGSHWLGSFAVYLTTRRGIA